MVPFAKNSNIKQTNPWRRNQQIVIVKFRFYDYIPTVNKTKQTYETKTPIHLIGKLTLKQTPASFAIRAPPPWSIATYLSIPASQNQTQNTTPPNNVL